MKRGFFLLRIAVLVGQRAAILVRVEVDLARIIRICRRRPSPLDFGGADFLSLTQSELPKSDDEMRSWEQQSSPKLEEMKCNGAHQRCYSLRDLTLRRFL